MKTPTFIKARVCVKLDGDVLCTTHEKKVVLAVVDDTRGVLLDGREVFKVEGWWYYIPPKGAIMQPVDDSPPWVPPIPPQPPVTAPEPQQPAKVIKPKPVEQPKTEKPKEKKGFFRL